MGPEAYSIKSLAHGHHTVTNRFALPKGPTEINPYLTLPHTTAPDATEPQRTSPHITKLLLLNILAREQRRTLSTGSRFTNFLNDFLDSLPGTEYLETTHPQVIIQFVGLFLLN